ncbi:hypothetical protein [Mucilaginibacter myungsuensis]|uniref:DUF4374 domain-containing protein n=1 Tax=Mucilaginibacter myungsuensis TaxID=649104 RepID=A0A929PXC2_9SPHI|nr:hypothetical protein [Mucilaginibacter myungsuensis]MBE9663708.1 hypothetical protein [Mucilaginibacter myungsuensis]MDN3598968.1 hypothetical protein [Mucilaginibacter myungsuensis]
MKKQFLQLLMMGAVATTVSLTGCSKKTETVAPPTENLGDQDRWVTLAGALVGTNPGDGNGGTVVYSVSAKDARDPNKSISVYDNGFSVRSQRTARLQSSLDGSVLFNIAYTGANGGEFSKYRVDGGGNYTELSDKVNISSYATTSPRWLKLFDSDKTGIAVNVSNVVVTRTNSVYQHSRGTSTVLSLNLEAAAIKTYEQYQIPLLPAEEAQGFYIGRLDGPVLNKAGNKLIIGVSKSKHDPATGLADNASTAKIPAKSLVVDYPSLKNPTLISSTVSQGNTNGYRSFNAFLADDGNIYQATQNGVLGSHILKIDQNNQYDNSYVFSLDAALGVTGTYVEAWRYAGNGVGVVAYSVNNAGGYLALVNLNTKTATKIAIPEDPDLSFGQYQGFVLNGEEVYVTVTPTGKDGNIYIINTRTGVLTKGAKLVNKTGNHYIGIF